MFPSQLPLALNEEPEVCPECKQSTAIYSVYRDMGSQRYCGRCMTVRWPNPNHDRGARLIERMRAKAAGS